VTIKSFSSSPTPPHILFQYAITQQGFDPISQTLTLCEARSTKVTEGIPWTLISWVSPEIANPSRVGDNH